MGGGERRGQALAWGIAVSSGRPEGQALPRVPVRCVLGDIADGSIEIDETARECGIEGGMMYGLVIGYAARIISQKAI